jgi:endoglycosylceramidase
MEIMKNLVVISILFGCILSKIRIDKQRNFIDDKGRVVIFHGVNVVVKSPPYIPNTEKWDPFNSLTQQDYEYFKKFGFNLVRLGVPWEAIEKAPGVYDHEHLEKIAKIVDDLGSHGIHTILDAHQDMFSRQFCGEGVPLFYARELRHEKECKTNLISRMMRMVGGCIPLNTFNWKYSDDGLPGINGCKVGFLKYHQSPELTTIYQSFYDNENNIQDKFAQFWKILAQKFKNNPYVIGHDIWNEPWPGELWSNINSMRPGFSANYQVLPFYRKVDQEIRNVDDEYILMFEPPPFPDTLPYLGGIVLGGFLETPAGKKYLDRQVLNIHMYCCQARADVCETGEPSLYDAKNICKKYHKSKLGEINKNAENLGVPFIVSEFGACSDSEACYYEMEAFVQAAEEFLISWAYWMYKPYGDHTTSALEHTEGMFFDNGLPQENKIKALTRTYIQAYQGIPLTSNFKLKSATFTSSFIYNSEIDSPTIIYYHREYFYPNGHVILITDENGVDVKCNYDYGKENYISFKINQEFIQKNPVIIVKLYRLG